MVNLVNDALTDLRNLVNKEEIPENKNPDEKISIVEKIPHFNKQ